MKMNKIIFAHLLCLFLLLEKASLQSEIVNELKLDTPVLGYIKLDNGFNFYKLTIPSGIQIDTHNLVMRVKETSQSEQGESFSDPDIYVSKTNNFPKSQESSTWYSERYGEDLISIPNSYVKEGDTFYIGVYCEQKCSYELLTKLEEEHEISLGELYRAYILKNDELSFKLKIDRDFDELDIVAYSRTLGFFKLLVKDNERPTSENSIKVIPSWMGAYTVSIPKSSENYCINCYYYILLEAGSADTEIFFFTRFEKTVTKIGSEEPLFSALQPFKKHCYKYKIDVKDRYKNVIIQTVVFNGSVELKYKMDKLPEIDLNLSDLLSNDIQTEKYIKISSDDRSPNYGHLNFCLNSVEASSYMVKIFFEEDIERFQKSNFLFKNREVNGYLPSEKATRYKIVEYNYNSNITITMKVKNGDPKLYGYICMDVSGCEFNKEEISKQKYSGALIPYQEFSIGYKVFINNSMNLCHETIKTLAENANELKDYNVPCATLAVVLCEGTDECEYSLTSHNEAFSLQLLPKRPHYKTIPYNETDYYTIDIQDSSVDQINIILNTITGNADLVVEFSDNEADYYGFSSHESYLPDVVSINREKINKTSLIGSYRAKVYGSSFSTYSIYYYFTNKNNDSPSLPKVIMDIETGHIIKDIYEPNTQYKIYSYVSNSYDDLDIRITLTPEKDDYNLYVFTDLKKFGFNANETRWKVNGYQWTDNYSNEIVISKNDTNFKRGATYYVVVTRSSYSLNYSKFVSKFWLGVTNENTPFLLYEGVPNTVTLDSNYQSQTYWYTHGPTNEPLGLSLNVYFGKVDLYIDFGEIDKSKPESAPIYYLNTETTFITIDSLNLQSKCRSLNNCQIYILIVKSSFFDSQYLITAKSHPSFAEFLPSGIIKTDTVLSGECRNYNILTDSKHSNAIFVTFLSGYGELYIKVPHDLVASHKGTYPTPKDYDYKGEDYYMGKTINLNSKFFVDTDPGQILATVCGNYLKYSEDIIEYNISFYDQAKKINQNQALRGVINEGEIQYFNLFFSKNAENVYISLTNLMGDVDVFVNYGLEFPSFNNATWVSATPYSEFIEFDKEDNYFVSRKLQDVSGNYTIMLYGATNSSYTLFATSHPQKIVAVSTEASSSCKSEANSPCYFRYNDFVNNTIEDIDIIITTDFLYGLGSISANIYENADYEISNNLPTSSKCDYSNKYDTTNNILQIKIKKDYAKLSKNSMLLIAVECKDKCFFELNIANMFLSDVKYLAVNRENIFYIYKSSAKTTLIFYNWSSKDLNLAAYSYKGMANIRIYTNDTNYDDKGVMKNDLIELKKFSLDYTNNPTYHNTISNSAGSLSYRNIFFEVEPLTDIGFYIKLTHDKEWTQIKINKLNSLSVDPKTNSFYGYFDLMNEFDNTVVTVRSLTKDVSIRAAMKYMLLDKSYANFDQNSKPTWDTQKGGSDIEGKTDPILSSYSAKIPRLPSDKTEGKFSRIFVQLQLIRYASRIDDNIKFDILVSTNVNGTSVVEAEQQQLIFPQIDHKNEDEIRIYKLSKKFPTDSILILEISTCIGSIQYKICDRMITNKDEECSLKIHHETTDGRKLIIIDLKQNPSENFYVLLWHKKQPSKDCRVDKDNKYVCVDKTEATIYYFTTTSQAYQTSFATNKGALTFKNYEFDSVQLSWGKMLSNSAETDTVISEAHYDVYVSEDTFDYEHMDSICYLSRLNNSIGGVQIIMNEDSTAIIRKLEPNKKYYVNVLAKSKITNEIIAYKPIEINFDYQAVPLYLIVLGVFMILILGYSVYYFYKKYKLTKKILQYEISDVRNMGTLPKSETELENVIKAKQSKKYANLADHSTVI